MANFMNKFANAVKGKIVAKKVNDYLNNIDETVIENALSKYSIVINNSISAISETINTTIIHSKPAIVKLAEKNSNELIELVDIMKKLGDVIDRVTTDENKEIVHTLANTIVDSVKDRVHVSAMEADIDTFYDSVEEVAHMFVKPREPKFFVFNATGEHIEVTEEEFNARKRFVINKTGVFNHYTKGKDSYEKLGE